MGKRPLLYELIETATGVVLYSTQDKAEAFTHIRQMLVNEPRLRDEGTFLITENGKETQVLARFTGRAFVELLEDEE